MLLLSSAFLSGPDYLALPRDPQMWVLKDLITTGGLTNIYGAPKTGKSFAAIGMAEAISSGKPYWLTPEFKVLKPGPVAYLQIDTPRSDWAERLEKIRRAGHDLTNIYFCDMLMTPDYPFNIHEQAEWLARELKHVAPVVTFIDTLREAHGGDENDSTVMRNVITTIVKAARPSNCSLISHSRKTNDWNKAGDEDLMEDNRGSSYTAGKMDVVVKFTGNGQHATGMQWRGRSVGAGKLAILQENDPDTGLIILDGEHAKYLELIHRVSMEMRGADASVSINKIAEAVAKETKHRGKRTISDDVSDVLRMHGLSPKVRK